jgi:hypothetical protein
VLDEKRKLTDDHGHRENDDDRDESNAESNDGKRGDEPVHAEPLYPIGERVEKIGKHHARYKRQQNLMQQNDDRCRGREDCYPK